MPALGLIGRCQRVNAREFRPRDRFHLGRSVQFHGARTQRNHRPIQCQVLIREAAQVAHHLSFGAVLVEDGVLHVVVGAQQCIRDTKRRVSFGGQLPTEGLHKAPQHGIIMRLTH